MWQRMLKTPLKVCPIFDSSLFSVFSPYLRSPGNITLAIPLKSHSASGSQQVRPSEKTLLHEEDENAFLEPPH